jgi:hypothetical protein
MLDYAEKRDYPRMSVECAARYRLDGDTESHCAIAKDLSGNGLLLHVEEEVAPGSGFLVEIRPGKNITPPLFARAEVLRCQPLGEASGGVFALACRIEQMLTEDEVPLDFP